MPCSLFILMSRRNGTCENSRVGETGVGEMGQSKGEMGTNLIITDFGGGRYMYIIKRSMF